MDAGELADLIKRMDALEQAFYDFAEAWLLAPDEVQDVLNDVGNFPFQFSLDEQGAEFGAWSSRAQESLREITCESCKRVVDVGRGGNYQFDVERGFDICNECFEKRR